MNKNYNFSEIESKWQKIWEEKADLWEAKDSSDKPKFYSLFEFPYPSGEGLHMGHLRGQTAVDVIARKKRLEGYNVMQPIGWDAFGLPTENYAIKNKIHPRVATEKNISSIKRQEKSLGYFLDWSREINTTDPKYYRWTQWLFLQFFKHGLAYKSEMPINWCPKDKIGLAKEEVIDGKCERCGTPVEKKNLSQWMLKITAYADKLIEGLKDLDFPERVKTQQINWIGKSEGTEINFLGVFNDKEFDIPVFTSRADTLFGVVALVLSLEHPLVSEITGPDEKEAVEKYILDSSKKSDIERTSEDKDKTGVFTGSYVQHPLTGEKIPVWIADYVLNDYGTGAVMMVPAHDERDYEFAKKYDLPIKIVITDRNQKLAEDNKAFIDYGILANSNDFDGLTSEEAKRQITEKLKSEGKGDFVTNYRLRDWIFSRQHYWGEPIPIVFCDKCGEVPVPEDQLPVELPNVENYEPTDTGESPLAKMTDWVNTNCPKCGGKAKRETDTMPNWAGSSWYFLRYIDPKNDIEFADYKKMEYWLGSNKDASGAPRSSKSGGGVDLYEGGPEHTTLHLLYSRFWNEFLHDIGLVPVSEPYKKRVMHGIFLAEDGRKMSKSYCNTISPDDIIQRYGADTARTYAMFIGPFEQTIAWDMKGLAGVWRFLNKVWENMAKETVETDDDLESELQKVIQGVTDDINGLKMNTAIAKLMEFNNLLYKKSKIPTDIKEKYMLLLYPYAPHLAEEVWQTLGHDTIINVSATWPKSDKSKIQDSKLVIPIQINGKVRDQIELLPDASEEDSRVCLEELNVKKHLEGKNIKKYIYIPGKIISIVV